MDFFARLRGKPKLPNKDTIFTPKNNWIIVRKLHNPICGDHFLMQNSSSGKLLMKKLAGTEDSETAVKLENKLKDQIRKRNKFVISILDYELRVKSELCSQYFFFSIFYPYPEKSVNDLFNEQMNKEEAFSHELLMDLFYNSIEGLLNLHDRNPDKDMGILQMGKIFWNAESQTFKVIENILNQKGKDIYANIFFKRDKFALIPPEIITNKRQSFDILDKSKMDTFNLGLILLCLGQKIHPKEFYNNDFTAMHLNKLSSQISLFKTQYKENPLLCRIVADLLTIDHFKRNNLKTIKRIYPSIEQVSAFMQKSSIQNSYEIDRYSAPDRNVSRGFDTSQEKLKRPSKYMTANYQNKNFVQVNDRNQRSYTIDRSSKNLQQKYKQRISPGHHFISKTNHINNNHNYNRAPNQTNESLPLKSKKSYLKFQNGKPSNKSRLLKTDSQSHSYSPHTNTTINTINTVNTTSNTNHITSGPKTLPIKSKKKRKEFVQNDNFFFN